MNKRRKLTVHPKNKNSSHLAVETVAACIAIAIFNKKQKEMMPMKNIKTYIFNFVKTAASFAAYAITLIITQDASAATALD